MKQIATNLHLEKSINVSIQPWEKGFNMAILERSMIGFKDEEKALYTIKKIKSKSVKYQIGVLNTLIGRAKSHPYQTVNMRKAIKILEKYKKNLME